MRKVNSPRVRSMKNTGILCTLADYLLATLTKSLLLYYFVDNEETRSRGKKK